MTAQELRLWEQRKEEVQYLRAENQHLRLELLACQPALYRADRRNERLQKEVEKLRKENRLLKQRVRDLTQALQPSRPPVPSFVKPSLPARRRRGVPGRKSGHRADLRPLPTHIDQQIQVPLPTDRQGQACCPHCHTQLSQLKQHRRIVEDILPAQLQVSCYQTTSGYCPSCRKRVESRAAQQPPAAEVAGSQLGLHALATAAVFRVHYRLPFRLVSQVFADLPGLSISPGAVARQLQRLGRWLEDDYQQLMHGLRAAPAVHMDETGWRTNGRNDWLWTMSSDRHTLYHVDHSRSGKVVAKLLGQAYAGTLQCDFYSAYNDSDCRKQRCCVHLLRELKETAQQHPDFAAGRFYRRCKRLIREMLKLKGQFKSLSKAEYQQRGQRLEERLDELAQTSWGEAEADRLAGRLRRYRPELTVFLWREEVDADNNEAERSLRPAVVARKISGGSRSEKGAKASAIVGSILRTIHQQQLPLVQSFETLLQASWAGKPLPLLFNTS